MLSLQFIFWISIGILVYNYFIYPSIVALIAVIFGKTVIKGEIMPKVSLIIPVYNEAEIIEKKIKNSLQLDYPKDKLEIIVASESTDDTNLIVEVFKKEGIVLYTNPKQEGKAATLYRVLPLTKGEIIIFTDVNVTCPSDTIKKLVHNFYDPKVGCVLSNVVISNINKSSITKGENLYKKYEKFLRIQCSKLGIILGADGAFFAIRKKLYTPIDINRGDDFELPIRIILQHYKVVFDENVLVYEDASLKAEIEFKRKIRIVAWNFRSALILLKEALATKQWILCLHLLSHKILRWLIPFFAIIIFIANLFLISMPFYCVIFTLQIFFYLTALMSYYLEKNNKKLPVFCGIIFYWSISNLAFLIGIIKFVFREPKINKWKS